MMRGYMFVLLLHAARLSDLLAAGREDEDSPPSASTEQNQNPHAAFQRCLQSDYPQTREDFPHLLNCLHLTNTAVEIGVQRGVHAKQFLNKWKGKQLLLVDKWTHVVSDTYIDIANIPSESMVALKEIAVNNLKTTVPRYRILQEWSEDAARKHVENESLDFVYLDARHDFNGVFADLVAWWPKLKIGGIIAGHDYCDGELPEGDFFVQTAVASFLEGGKGDGVDGGGTGSSPDTPQKPAVHTTREAARFTSFFVLKTKELDARVKSNSFRSFPIDHVYSRHSWYFSLFYRDPDNFKKKCQTLCQFDCDRRLRQLFPEDFALATRPVCLGEVSTANASPSTSTGRSPGGQEPHKDVIVTDVTTRPPTTSAAMELTEGSTPSGASSSCIASESALAQLQRESPTHGEFSSYQTECKRRCKVTCGQRQKLFADIRNKETASPRPTVFRVDPEYFKNVTLDPVPHEEEFVLDDRNFLQDRSATSSTSSSTSTTSSLTEGRFLKVIGDGKKGELVPATAPAHRDVRHPVCGGSSRHQFRWGEPEVERGKMAAIPLETAPGEGDAHHLPRGEL